MRFFCQQQLFFSIFTWTRTRTSWFSCSAVQQPGVCLKECGHQLAESEIIAAAASSPKAEKWRAQPNREQPEPNKPQQLWS